MLRVFKTHRRSVWGTGGLGFTDQGSCLLDALSDGDLHATGCMLWERWDDQPIFAGSMATQCNSSTVHCRLDDFDFFC